MIPGLRRLAAGPFRVRNFRFQWSADLLVSWAFEMETLILGWYVLVATGSVLVLTLFGALQFLGTLVAPMVGVVGDRIGYRNLLAAMRAIYTVIAAALMALAFAGLLDPTVVLLLAALTGIVRPSDQGMRAALVAATVPSTQLLSAMAVSRTTTDSARIAGALAGAGLFAALGMGPAYVVVAIFYGLGFLLTLAVSARPFPAEPLAAAAAAVKRASPWRELTAGIAYVWRTPRLLAAMSMAFLVNLAAFPLTNGLLPYVARDIYRTDQTGLGLLLASAAAGALAGSLVMSAISRWARAGRMTIIFGVIWFVMLALFAQVDTAGLGMALLATAGFAQSLSMIALSVILLRTSDEAFRGRVMGVRVLAVYSLPLGLLASGFLIERFGFHATATGYCLIGLVFTVVIGFVWRADLWRPDAMANER